MIKVRFIDSSNEKIIGVSKMPIEKLPDTFEVQTTMYLNNQAWSVQEAIPVHSREFIQSKNLTLKMRKVEQVKPEDVWFSIPTISKEFPQTEPKTKDSNFDISIHEDDYRQKEFLKIDSLPKIERELEAINEIWENHSEKKEGCTLFKNCHARETTGLANLLIEFDQIKALLNANSIGQVITNEEVLSNSFGFKTDNTTYFGIFNDQKVAKLCILDWNNKTINEILKINKEFKLVFVDWVNCNIIKND